MDDCLIVGAGVVGLSLAYELAGHGLRVRVVDRQEPGREASWAGAGILPPANRATATHPLEQLRGMSHRLHAEWAARLQDETGIDTGYRRCGGIYLARTVGETAALHGLASEFREQGIEVERLSADALAQLEPALITSVRAAYLVPDEAQLRNPAPSAGTCRRLSAPWCRHRKWRRSCRLHSPQWTDRITADRSRRRACGANLLYGRSLDLWTVGQTGREHGNLAGARPDRALPLSRSAVSENPQRRSSLPGAARRRPCACRFHGRRSWVQQVDDGRGDS